MHIYGRHAVADLLDDFVAYRNIRPADRRLPGLAEIAPNTQPRKGDDAYANVAVTILNAAQALRKAGHIQRFCMIGDTRQSDGGTYTTIAKRTGWAGAAFICDEKANDQPSYSASSEAGIMLANRWSAIDAFAAQQHVDAQTAIIIDLDKTLIGARGRNHHLIDTARLTALKSAVIDVLGDDYDEGRFSETYHCFNQPRFHRFTGDNQDFLAFICVMAGGNIVTPEALQAMFAQGMMRYFDHFVDLTEARVHAFQSPLAPFHHQFTTLYRAGDMTPFKSFRYLEYTETAKRFGCASDAEPVTTLLNSEIVITGELWQQAQRWKAQGALLFGLSDKPDEAACGPDNSKPIHRLVTHVVGE